MTTTAPLPKQTRTVTVNGVGKRMAYYDSGRPTDLLGNGAGERTIVFLHGNPTSSYLWRNIIPHVGHLGRVVAVDLIGHGDSDALNDSGPDRYTFVEHRDWLEALFEDLGLGDRVVLVVHDWGSALGFHWAHRHADRVAGIVYMEAIVGPIASWDDWPEAARSIFQGFRSPAGEEMVLEKNLFVDAVLPASILRDLEPEERAEYGRRFTEPGESRRPTLTWPRQIPIAGDPADVTEIAASYAEWLSRSDVPKLFINANPGAILVGAQRDRCRTWPNQTEVTVTGNHFIQEDSPNEIGAAIAAWID